MDLEIGQATTFSALEISINLFLGKNVCTQIKDSQTSVYTISDQFRFLTPYFLNGSNTSSDFYGWVNDSNFKILKK